VEDAVCPGLQHPAEPHEPALGRPGHDVDRADTPRAHQSRGRPDPEPLMLHVQPDAVEALQADQVQQRPRAPYQGSHQHTLASAQLRLDLARSHPILASRDTSPPAIATKLRVYQIVPPGERVAAAAPTVAACGRSPG